MLDRLWLHARHVTSLSVLLICLCACVTSCTSDQVNAIVINPSDESITLPAFGYQYGWSYKALGYYGPAGSQRVKDITDQVTWFSYAPEMVSISNAAGSKGTASTSGFATGVTYITASINGFRGLVTSNMATVNLSVSTSGFSGASNGTVISIVLSPIAPTIAAGKTQAFIATATTADGSTPDVTTSCIWTSSNTSVATVNSSGVLTAVAAGNSVITATYTNLNKVVVVASTIVKVS